MARQVLPIVGAAIGGYFGGVQGAQWGWMIGSIVGNVVDPQVIKGPSIGDLAQQTSQEGVPRPIVFGVSPPMAGNIIYAAEPQIVKSRQRQGKGGPVTETQNVYRTYAIGVSEGPINAFLRVWRNGVLVYDVTPWADPSMAAKNIEFIKHARFFLGGYDQLPSPDIEAILGIGETPAFRGTSYLVMANEDLTDLRGAVPQYAFQVMRCEGTVVTSRPYAIEARDDFQAYAGPIGGRVMLQPFPLDFMTADASLTGGALFAILQQYDAGPDSFQADASLTGGALFAILQQYDAGPDSFQADASLTGGDLFTSMVSYDIPAESITADATLTGGVLI